MEVLVRRNHWFVAASLLGIASIQASGQDQPRDPGTARTESDAERLLREEVVRATLREGLDTFRYDTFGDEAFWGDQLRLHEAIAGARLGGVGKGLSPNDALGLGLKIDVAALPPRVVDALLAGTVDLDDPAVTLALLRLDAVIGVTGFFGEGRDRRSGRGIHPVDPTAPLQAVGIQCALCHSTVDDSFSPGIGNRRDGWANRDLDIGVIIAHAANLQPVAELLGVSEDTVRTVVLAWGPGKFDAELFLDGKGFRDDGKTAATLIPPVFGLAGVNLSTWTGWGSIPYWNAFVANLEMHGKGSFFDPRLDDAVKFPIAAKNGFGHVTSDVDLISAKLPALHAYQLSLPAPTPPPGSFDVEAADRGDVLFSGKARCARCHTEGTFSEPGWNMHAGSEIGIDDFQALRSPDGRYRTAPLNGLWTHTTGGFFHDGRFATLDDVVAHYDTFFVLGLTEPEKGDLVEYLNSLPRDEKER